MTRHLTTFAASVGLVALASCEIKAAELYAGPQGTYSLDSYSTSNDEKIETGEENRFGGALVFGAQPRRWAFGELELGYANAELHGYNPTFRPDWGVTGEIRTGYGLASVGLVAPTPWVQPYVSAGLGAGYEDVQGRISTKGAFDKSRAVVAYQYGGGLQATLGPVTVRGGLRYFEAGAIQQAQATVGLAWRFGE